METPISLPDKLFVRAEEYAKAHGLTINELYAKAVRDYIGRKDKKDKKQIVRKINEICENIDTSLNPQMRAAAKRILSSSEW